MPSDTLAINAATRPIALPQAAGSPVSAPLSASSPTSSSSASAAVGVAQASAASAATANGVAGTASVAQPDASAGTAAGASATDPAATKPDAASLKKAVAALNDSIQPHFGSIEFSVDEDSGKTLLKIVDTETNTLLMQIPSKQALALASAQDAGTRQGLLIKDSA